eukprot:3650262-Pyramimonas_sp.AAC.2
MSSRTCDCMKPTQPLCFCMMTACPHTCCRMMKSIMDVWFATHTCARAQTCRVGKGRRLAPCRARGWSLGLRCYFTA